MAAMASATIYYSCSKEDAQQPQTEEFSKTIEVFDDCGLNSVVLKLTSDDKSVVDMYSADNFQLIINPAPYDEPETDADVDDEEDDDEIDDFSDSDAIKIGMCVVEENFVEEVTSYDIEKTQPNAYHGLRAKWSKDYIFSETKRGVVVTRTSINRRIYVTTKRGNTGTSSYDIEYSWETGKQERLLSNGDSQSDYTCDHRYIGAIIRAKKHHNKYTCGFFTPSCNK